LQLSSVDVAEGSGATVLRGCGVALGRGMGVLVVICCGSGVRVAAPPCMLAATVRATAVLMASPSMAGSVEFEGVIVNPQDVSTSEKMNMTEIT